MKQTRSDLSTDVSKWFAIYCKYKCEKLIADRLEKKGIHAYVPLVSQTKRYTRKIKVFHKPLFNSYVFVKIRKQDYVRVLETDHVQCFVKINRELIAIPDKEILLLKRIVGETNNLELNQDFIEGMNVEVIGGNLTGLKGKLISTANNKNFLVELENIGFQLRMQINPAFLRQVDIRTESMIA